MSRACPPARWAAEVPSPRAVLLHGLWLVRLASISPPGHTAEGRQGPPSSRHPRASSQQHCGCQPSGGTEAWPGCGMLPSGVEKLLSLVCCEQEARCLLSPAR